MADDVPDTSLLDDIELEVSTTKNTDEKKKVAKGPKILTLNTDTNTILYPPKESQIAAAKDAYKQKWALLV